MRVTYFYLFRARTKKKKEKKKIHRSQLLGNVITAQVYTRIYQDYWVAYKRVIEYQPFDTDYCPMKIPWAVLCKRLVTVVLPH